MPNTPLLLSDNLYDNVVLHPAATVFLNAPATEAVGHEVWRVADNLRDMTWCSPSASNVLTQLRTDLGTGQTAEVSMLVLDRNHNLSGKSISLTQSSDAVTYTTVWTATPPSTPGGLPTDANGCLTSEGVWWKTFAPVTNRAFSFDIPATSGFTPIVTGLYLGDLYRVPEFMDAPGAFDFHQSLKYLKNEVSQGGVRVKSRPVLYDLFQVRIQSMDAASYPPWQTNINRLLRQQQPWWVCMDDSDAGAAGLLRLFSTTGDTEYKPVVDPIHRTISLDLESVAPVLYV